MVKEKDRLQRPGENPLTLLKAQVTRSHNTVATKHPVKSGFTHPGHQQVNDSESVKMSIFSFLLDFDLNKNIHLLLSYSFA